MALFEQGTLVKGDPMGHFELTLGSVSATALPSPASMPLSRVRRVIIRPLDRSVRYRDDGIDPTPSTGMKIFFDEAFVYDAAPEALRLIADTSAAGNPVTVLIAYYGA